MKFPRSPYDQAGGLVYFPRMLDKIRLHAAGELSPDFHGNLGQGMDGRCCRYLHVDYAAVVARVQAGDTDQQVFDWINAQRRLNADEILAWNAFVSKRGWKDEASAFLAEAKQRSGLAHRDDIQTLFDFFEVDEKRKP